MRWSRRKSGEKRIKRVFLLFPKELNGETRWLEVAYIEQRWGYCLWSDERWVDRATSIFPGGRRPTRPRPPLPMRRKTPSALPKHIWEE